MNKTQQSAQEFARAMALLQQGRFAEAVPVYQAILRREPKNIGAANLLGVALIQAGQLEDAVTAIKHALALDPNQGPAHYNLGTTLHSLGRYDEAIGHFEQAVRLDPNDAQAQNNLGAAFKSLSRYGESAEAYRRAVALRPDYAEAHVNLATVLFHLNEPRNAIRQAETALALNAESAEAHLVIGNALREEGLYNEALQAFRRSIHIQPNRAEGYAGAGHALLECDMPKDAVAFFEKALLFAPSSFALHLKLALALYLSGRHQDAAAAAEKGFALPLADAEDEVSAAMYLQYVNRHQEAFAHYQNALKLDPASKVGLLGCGNALLLLNRPEEALKLFDEALASKAREHTVLYNKALAFLGIQDFSRGWRFYGSRHHPEVSGTVPQIFPASVPQWQGEYLKGTLLIWGEQGLGDQIIYASMLSDVAGRAESIVVMVERRLIPLLARSFPQLRFCTFDDGAKMHFDAQIAIGDLGALYRNNKSDFPCKPYLAPDYGKAAGLRERLNANGEISVGISWRSMNAKVGEHKTARIEDFASLLKAPGIRMVDLQYGDTQAELEAVHQKLGTSVIHIDEIDNTNDIDGLAALIEACDLVLTVSNTTAHIAGALGKPVWVMVPYGQGRFWYWFRERTDSPWYPRARIVRQQPGQSWADLIASITPEITAFTRESKKEAN